MQSKNKNFIKCICILLVMTLLISCHSQLKSVPRNITTLQQAQEVYDKFDENQKALAAVTLAYDLMMAGEVDAANQFFEQASGIIETVYAEDQYAEKAASLWHGESEKIFRGEPYERAMTYFYFGLSFMLKEDFENARNCFRSARFQDSFAAEDQHRSDFYIADYLESYCDFILEENADASLDILSKIITHREALGTISDDQNFLIICTSGQSPQKVLEGDYKEYLTFREGRDQVWAVEMTSGNEKYYIYDAGNTFYQAVTRGGRFVDSIMKRKAVYKRSAKIGANVCWAIAVASLAMAANTSDANQQMALYITAGSAAALGLTFHIIYKQITPKADNRQISVIPNRLYLRACHINKEVKELSFDYYDRYMKKVGNTVTVPIPEKRKDPSILFITEHGVSNNWSKK